MVSSEVTYTMLAYHAFPTHLVYSLWWLKASWSEDVKCTKDLKPNSANRIQGLTSVFPIMSIQYESYCTLHNYAIYGTENPCDPPTQVTINVVKAANSIASSTYIACSACATKPEWPWATNTGQLGIQAETKCFGSRTFFWEYSKHYNACVY